MNYRNCVLNFLSSLLTNRQWLYYGPIMARTQILVHRGEGGGAEQGFRRRFADGVNESLVSSVAQASSAKQLA